MLQMAFNTQSDHNVGGDSDFKRTWESVTENNIIMAKVLYKKSKDTSKTEVVIVREKIDEENYSYLLLSSKDPGLRSKQQNSTRQLLMVTGKKVIWEDLRNATKLPGNQLDIDTKVVNHRKTYLGVTENDEIGVLSRSEESSGNPRKWVVLPDNKAPLWVLCVE